MRAVSFKLKLSLSEGDLRLSDGIFLLGFQSAQLIRGFRNWVLPHHACFTLWNMEVTVIAFEHPVRKFQASQVVWHGPQGHVLQG